MPVIPSGSHQPATSNDEIFQEASERLRIAEQSEGANRQAAVIDLEFEDGQQWPTDIYNQRKVSRRPTLTINHTRAMVKRVVNNMRMQRPRIKVHPVGDGADVDLAQKIGGLIRHIEQRSEGATAYDIGGESAVKMGWGYWRILSEYIAEDSFEQELKIAPIRNPFTVYMDPGSILPAGEDAEWCLITETMKRSEFERKYPEEAETEWRDGGQGDMSLEWRTKEEIRLAEYFRIVKKKDTLVKLTSGESVYLSQMKEGQQIAKNLRGDEIRRPAYRRQLEWHRLNGSTVVESVDLPGKWIPVVRCEGNVMDLNGQIRRKGMVRDLIDVARMVNYWRHLSLDTPLPTPTGWTTMGEVKSGDMLFNEHGKPCKVLGKSPIYVHKDCYRITFDDGSQVIASGEHEWPVEQRGPRNAHSFEWLRKSVLTKDLQPRKDYIYVTAPLDLPKIDLPLDPYLLGVWLGNGTAVSTSICHGKDDVEEMRKHLSDCGYSVGPCHKQKDETKAPTFSVYGIRQILIEEGLLGRKHIPQKYLRASHEQRLALIQGLMDTDGSVSAAGQCSFTNINLQIVQGLAELLRSIGIKAIVIKRAARLCEMPGGYQSKCSESYQFSFTTRKPIFRMARKLAGLGKRPEQIRRTHRHRIDKVERIASVPVQCLAIDSPSHLFLCGEAMIPTHNTCETEVIALAPRAPWVGTTNHFDGHPEWNDANQVPYSKLTYTPDFIEQPDGSKTPLPPPQRVEPVAVPAGFVQAAESALKDLMILAGMPHEPGQDAPGQVVSGKALRARQALSDIGHFQYYDNQTKSICHTGRIILDLIPYYYSEARMQRIIGEDGVPEVVGINQPQDPNEGGAGAELPLLGQPPIDPAVAKIKNDLTVGRYDVVMDTGPGFETKRMEAVDSMLDLMRTPLGEPVVKVGADLVVRNMDWPGASDLADRLAPLTPQGLDKAIKSLPKQAQGIVTAMQQQLQQAQQEIQGLQQELKLKTNIENNWIALEKYKVDQQTQVKANDAALKAHTSAMDTHTKAQASIAVAEIGATGKIIDSHVQGGHAKEAAEVAAEHAAEKAEKAEK